LLFKLDGTKLWASLNFILASNCRQPVANELGKNVKWTEVEFPGCILKKRKLKND
jgi:hypothetical protein